MFLCRVLHLRAVDAATDRRWQNKNSERKVKNNGKAGSNQCHESVIRHRGRIRCDIMTSLASHLLLKLESTCSEITVNEK